MSITKGVYMTFVFLIGVVAIIFIIATTDSSKIMANTNENNSSQEQIISEEEPTPQTSQIEKISTQVSPITSTVSEYKYLLSVYNGKLALFNYDNINQEFKKEPAQIYSVYINSLPEYDANILENGIKIKTDNELNDYLQDYTS